MFFLNSMIQYNKYDRFYLKEGVFFMVIEKYFISDTFLTKSKNIVNLQKSYYEQTKVIQMLIYLGLVYYQFFEEEVEQDENNLTDFIFLTYYQYLRSVYGVNRGFDSNFKDFVTEKIKRKIGLNLTTEELRSTIGKILLKKHIYHSTNSSNLESIKKNGLNSYSRLTNQEDLNEINSIFLKYGISHILGWQKLNCEGKFSTTDCSDYSYYYGVNSPEWFSQFTGKSHWFNLEFEEKSAYERRNYEVAKDNLVKIMNENNFLYEDQIKVLEFFDNNWKIYAKGDPLIILMRENVIEAYDIEIGSLSRKELEELYKIHALFRSINGGRTDEQIKGTVDVNDALFISIPTIEQIKKYQPLESTEKLARIR